MAAKDSKQYIIVSLNSMQYGVEIKYIENIIVMQNITRVPKAQPYFSGIINLRGEIIPVMSLRKRLGLPESVYDEMTRIIIVKPEPQAASVGLIVDEVKEVISIDNANVELLTYDEKDKKANFSTGIGKQGNELINLLNIPGIVIEKVKEKEKEKEAIK